MPIETTTTQLQSDSPIGLEVAHAYAQDVLVSLVGAGGEVRADAPLPAITEFPVYRPNEARLSLGLGFCHANRVLYASREWRQQARSNDAKVAQLPSVWSGFFLKRPKHTFERALRNATLPGFKISSGLCGVEQSCWSACDEPMSQMIVPAILVHSFSNGTTEPRLDLDPRHLSAILNGVRTRWIQVSGHR